MTANACDDCGGSTRVKCYQVKRFGCGAIIRTVEWLCPACHGKKEAEMMRFKDGWNRDRAYPLYELTKMKDSQES